MIDFRPSAEDDAGGTTLTTQHMHESERAEKQRRKRCCAVAQHRDTRMRVIVGVGIVMKATEHEADRARRFTEACTGEDGQPGAFAWDCGVGP